MRRDSRIAEMLRRGYQPVIGGGNVLVWWESGDATSMETWGRGLWLIGQQDAIFCPTVEPETLLEEAKLHA